MDDNNELQEPSTEVKSFSEADVKGLLEKETAGLKAKIDELLGEKKSVAQKAKELEEQAKREKMERAKQEEDFKSLYESSETSRKELEQKHHELLNGIRTEKRDAEAMRLATQMADGSNAELLSQFIKQRIEYTDENKIMVLDSEGRPTVATLQDLKKEFETSGRYDSLLSGTKASGGAAKPTGRASGNTGTIPKSTQEKLDYYRELRERQ